MIIDTRMNDLRIYDGKCPTLRAQRDGVLYVKNGNIYQLTGFEALLLQGFPRDYAKKVKNEVSDRHLLMQAGNAMTVNVITEIGKQIIKICKQEDYSMRPGEAFEIECVNFLKGKYGDDIFRHQGGMDSTTSDIEVLKNGCVDYYIEAKDTSAQSGQFVLLPDAETRTFTFSPRNKSEQNEMTSIIIQYMNNDFDRFNNAGTAGAALNIDSCVFSDWIIKHYLDRNVKYVISYNNGFVIFPIRKFADYFDITATFRIKKSGSSKPPAKDFSVVSQAIKNVYPSASFYNDNSKLIATISDRIIQDKICLGKYTYFLSEYGHNTYEIRRLSNTYNMNVIFSVHLKKNQATDDLKEFESDL